MISGASKAIGARRRLDTAPALAARLARRLEGARPFYVVGAFVLAQWLLTLGVALDVRHNGWIWYQGGDQVWFYTTSWLLAHGQLSSTLVGYGWSVILMPFAVVGGPDLLQAMPAIVLLNVLVLMPVAMAAMYGIGERLGGRLFGYWVLLLWVVVPLVSIKYTNAGFHQRFTELSLPQALGLTPLSDFPSLVALAGGAYFVIRTVQRFTWTDALLAGGIVGFALGIKPSNALFLPGLGLALVVARRRRALGAIVLALLPAVLVLTFWKWRGLGYLPILHARGEARLALGAAGGIPLAGLSLQKYLHFNWGLLQHNLDTIREHFWSARVFEWTVVAGVVALARKALWVAALFGGWFLAFALVKGSDPLGKIQDASLLRMLIPAIPAFVLLLATLPLLVPGARARLPEPRPPREWGSPRTRGTVLGAAALLFLVVPTALAAAAHRLPDGTPKIVNALVDPIPTDAAFPLHASAHDGRVRLSWQRAHVAAGKVFYTVLRGSDCSEPVSLDNCQTKEALTTTGTSLVDAPPASGRFVYVVGISANWQNDSHGGDPYLASPPVPVTLP